MKVTLHLAISADGFIAKLDGDSSWVAPADEALFKERAREAGCLVVGKKTFDQYHGEIYPVADVLNIVMSRHPQPEEAGILYVSSPQEAIAVAQERSAGLLIAGGGLVSGSFLEAGLIDEVFLSVHPLFLYDGIRPFGTVKADAKLQFIDSRELGDGLIELHYGVQK